MPATLVHPKPLSLFVLLIILWTLCGLMACQAAAPDYAKTPVLFVHGHGLRSTDFDGLEAYLRRSGYPREYLMAVDIEPNTASNRVAAERFIAPAVSRLIDRANTSSRNAGAARRIERVDLVGHSMGAFSSRWYAVKVAPEKVRTWISVAGSNHGTAVLCAHHDPGAREMCPPFAGSGNDSEIQSKLNGTPDRPVDETPFGLGTDPEERESVAPDAARAILYLTLRLEPDEWIVPSRSAVVAGAGGIEIEMPVAIDAVESPTGNYLLRGEYDHMSVLASEEVFELIRVLLASRDP